MHVKPIRTTLVLVAATGLLTACAQPPMGPRVAVMPAPNKPFNVFQEDDATCRQFAQNSVAGTTEQANNAQVGGAIIGTILGAGLGAAVGGGQGAAIGAGAGAIGGTAYGSGGAQHATYSAQQRYDIAYSQCMYSHGNQVPGFVAPAHAPPPSAYAPPPPPPSAYAAPPPPPPPPAAYAPPPPPPPPYR
jgi:hypothetical protein